MITPETLACFKRAGVVAAARAFHRSTRTIGRLAKQFGIEFKTDTERQLERRRKERAALAPVVRKLARQRLSQAQICEALGITRWVLRHIAVEHHIDINSRSYG